MPANKYALLRYRIIDRCLNSRSNPFPKKEDLRQACEDALFGSMGDRISQSTIEKDLWAMRNEGDLGYYAPIVWNATEKGYYYEDEGYTINNFSLNEDDLEAITLAAATLDQFRNIPIFEHFGSAIDKVVQRVTISPGSNEKYIQFETAFSRIGTEFLSPLLKAIEKRLCVDLSYEKFSGENEKNYHLHPYLLKEYRSRWYLVAWEAQREKYLTFGLERIKHLNISEEKYSVLSNFDADRFFSHTVGITQIDEDPQKVELLVDEIQSKYLLTRPIHPSLKKKGAKNNKVLFELDVIPSYELIQWILSMGKSCEILAPEKLRKQIQSHLADTLSQYK